jgi:hypothetical protein
LESFVSEKYEDQNNTWFPIYKVGGDRQSNIHAQKAHGEDNDDEDKDEGDGNSSDGGSDMNNHHQHIYGSKQITQQL